MHHITFDLETGANLEMARELCGDYPKFDPDKVPLGNAKKPETIEAKIEEAREKHDKPETIDKFYSDFAKKHCKLVPEMSFIPVLTMMSDDIITHLVSKTGEKEEETLKEFWERYSSDRLIKYVGHSIFKFDLDMLIKRSLILGVHVPSSVYSLMGRRIMFSDRFVDIVDLWMLGTHSSEYMRNGRKYSLDYIAKALGVSQPRDYPVNGENFFQYLTSDNKDDVKLAMKYCADDVIEPDAIYKKFL